MSMKTKRTFEVRYEVLPSRPCWNGDGAHANESGYTEKLGRIPREFPYRIGHFGRALDP